MLGAWRRFGRQEDAGILIAADAQKASSHGAASIIETLGNPGD
jgi:hypothetical protein